MASTDFSEARQRSVALLRHAATPDGFVASVNAVTNYRRVWTRDGVITGLAALLSGDEPLIRTFRATLTTVFSHQHATGFFPSNVDPQTHAASYGGNCGRVDNVSWAVIGLMQYAAYANGDELPEVYRTNVEKALAVMDAWEFNGKHLLYVPQSGNWADEYVQHGYVLYDQLLRVWALELAGRHYGRTDWSEKAGLIRKTIARNYWNGETDAAQRDAAQLYAPNLVHQLKKAPGDFWLMGFNPAQVYSQFDLVANALALLLGVGTAAQNATLLAYLRRQLSERAFLLPSFDPAIGYGDFLMGELADNYAYEFRNIPHEFHNGGLWPVWNGWLGAALVHHREPEMANLLLRSLREANQQNADGEEWGFYENFHGTTRSPIGVQYCTWSAGGFLIAEAYQRGKRLV
ncbi:MAG: fructofuranosidase/invertase, partial [Ferruginibacter sp.]|nr:fructofuranosidase/invertase [Cytophagales bacterium]